MPEEKPHSLGDVHAPVEDTDVPGTLKLLVIVMVILLIGLGIAIGIAVVRIGPALLAPAS